MEEARRKEGGETGALWKERLVDSRLVKVIMEKMQDCSVSWQGEYERMREKASGALRTGSSDSEAVLWQNLNQFYDK